MWQQRIPCSCAGGCFTLSSGEVKEPFIRVGLFFSKMVRLTNWLRTQMQLWIKKEALWSGPEQQVKQVKQMQVVQLPGTRSWGKGLWRPLKAATQRWRSYIEGVHYTENGVEGSWQPAAPGKVVCLLVANEQWKKHTLTATVKRLDPTGHLLECSASQ